MSFQLRQTNSTANNANGNASQDPMKVQTAPGALSTPNNSMGVPMSQYMVESIARMNNIGVTCLQQFSNGGDGQPQHQQSLVEAGQSLKRALEKANAMTFFSAHAGNVNNSLRAANEKAGEVSKNLYIYQRGEYDEGMHTYSTPLSMEATAGLSMHAVTATILFNLGQLYLRLNEEQEATDAFLQALQIMHMGSPNGVPSGNHHHGSSMMMMADDSKKESNSSVNHSAGGRVGGDTKKTATVGSGSLAAPGPCHSKASPPATISLMALYHNLGHLQYRSGHYEDAVRTYSKALEIGRANVNPTSHQLLELAATLNCLGVLCFHLPQADTEQAMALYQESLTLRHAVLGKDAQTKEIATTLNNIGRVHYMKGAHAPALEWYQRALIMRRQLLGPDHLDVAAVRFSFLSGVLVRSLLGSFQQLVQ